MSDCGANMFVGRIQQRKRHTDHFGKRQHFGVFRIKKTKVASLTVLKHFSFNMTHFVCFWRVVWQGTARCAMRRIGRAV
jgi:hypothetical protein